MGAWLLRGVKRYPGDTQQQYDLRIDGDRITSWNTEGEGDCSGASIVDLAGYWVLPGFVDSHLHLLYSMEYQRQIDLAGLSLEEISTMIANSDSGPKIGHGWKDPLPERMKPDPRRFLDALVPSEPVFLWNADLHRALFNSKTLEIAGLSSDTHSGIAVEEDAECLWNSLPRSLSADSSAAADWLLSHGITAATTFDRENSIRILQRDNSHGELGVWIRHGLPELQMRSAMEVGGQCLPVGSRHDSFAMPWVKLFLDGTLGSRTAWMKSDYSDDPGNRGVVRLSGDALDEVAREAARGGWALAIHAIGDAAVCEANRAIALTKSLRSEDLPDRIEHFQLVDPTDLREIHETGTIASFQPCHLYQDRATLLDRWGPRSSNAFALRSVDNADIPIILGTDAPVEELDPWCDLQAAVMRLDRDGSGPPFETSQSVSFQAAFHWRSAGAAQGNFLPKGWGTLEPGTVADLQILGTVHPEKVRSQKEAQLLDVYSFGSWRLGRVGEVNAC
ncbi:MAG: amidohydrolase family protein [Planctomycetota bacterium]